jgi:mono/diheme cytochrome c family protein
VIVRTDPAARWQAIGAASAIGCATVLGLWAVLVRPRWRWPAAVVALLVVALAAPRLDLLFVPAVPTSFQHSPTGFAASGIVRGAQLFAANCASCHGAEGRGNGPATRGLAVAPGDLTAARVLDYGDGRMIWWLSRGIRAPAGDGLAMPGFAAKLSNRQQWELVDYVRAHALGALRSAAGWSVRARAPGFEATCPGGRTITLAGLRGRIVRLIVGGSAAALARPDNAASPVTIIAASGPRAAGDVCVAHDESVPSAYAIVAGLPPDGITGAEFLIDDHGWLRAVQTPGTRPGWDDAGVLARDVANIRAHPITAGGGSTPMPMNTQMKM